MASITSKDSFLPPVVRGSMKKMTSEPSLVSIIPKPSFPTKSIHQFDISSSNSSKDERKENKHSQIGGYGGSDGNDDIHRVINRDEVECRITSILSQHGITRTHMTGLSSSLETKTKKSLGSIIYSQKLKSNHPPSENDKDDESRLSSSSSSSLKNHDYILISRKHHILQASNIHEDDIVNHIHTVNVKDNFLDSSPDQELIHRLPIWKDSLKQSIDSSNYNPIISKDQMYDPSYLQRLPQYNSLSNSNSNDVYNKYLKDIDHNNNNNNSERFHSDKYSHLKDQGPSMAHKLLGDQYMYVYIQGLEKNQFQSMNSKSGYIYDLNLRDNRITDGCMSLIIGSIMRFDRIEILDLSENSIGRQGFAELGIYLPYTNNLRKLSLDKMSITDIGMKSLQKTILKKIEFSAKENPSLSLLSLSLSNNKIGDNGAIYIADILPYMIYLEEFDLSWNEIRYQGIKAILTTIMEKTNRKLTSLNISWNAIENGSNNHKNQIGKLLAKFISSSNSLLHLNITNNRLSSSNCKIIKESIQQNETLISFQIDGNESKIKSFHKT